MVNEIKASDLPWIKLRTLYEIPCRFLSSTETPHESWRTHRSKRYEYNNKDKDNKNPEW